VVSNAASLLTNPPLGKFVDQHHLVIRLNNAPTHGYQTYVGNRTSGRVVNVEAPKMWREGILNDLLPDGFVLAHSRNFCETWVSHTSLFCMEASPKWQKNGYNKFPYLNKKQRPSTGAISVLWLSQLCQSITLIGFNMQASSQAPYHYFGTQGLSEMKKYNKNTKHNFLTEHRIFRQMSYAFFFTGNNSIFKLDSDMLLDKHGKSTWPLYVFYSGHYVKLQELQRLKRFVSTYC